jgi:hypothetical protein
MIFAWSKYLTMILPLAYGNAPAHNTFIYTACDAGYFDEFAKVLVNSARAHTAIPVHLHIFNPRPDQLCWVEAQPNLSATFEHVDIHSFSTAASRLSAITDNPVLEDQLRRTQNAMTKGADRNILERMQKTYFACVRFIRLQQMITSTATVMAIDVDAVIRRQLTMLPNTCDYYIHRVTGKRARFLAGGIQLNPTPGARNFINEYSQQLQQMIESDCVYWGLDQDLLEHTASRYHWQPLPSELIDWNMLDHSVIWTAKGTRKSLAAFVNESARYKT